MPLTAEQLILTGIGTSARNRRGTLAEEQYELLDVLNRLTQQLFLDAAVGNPFYIGLAETVAFSASPLNGWPRPARALSVVRLEAVASGGTPTLPGFSEGQEIAVCAPDDLDAVRFEPAVVEMAGVFSPIPGGVGPTGGSLRIIAARRPVLLTLGGALSQTIDPAVPDDMAGYFVAGVARHLAVKDQRSDEAVSYEAQLGEMRALWAQMIGSATPATRRRFVPRTSLVSATQPTTGS